MTTNCRDWWRLFISLFVIGIDVAAMHYGICIYFLPTEEHDKTQYRRVAWAFLLGLFSVALSIRCVGIISETLANGEISFSLLLQWIFGKTKDKKGIKYWPSEVKFYLPVQGNENNRKIAIKVTENFTVAVTCGKNATHAMTQKTVSASVIAWKSDEKGGCRSAEGLLPF
eukprot:m.207225 g.207225  ORF g.207225 m.207225 type:complete len:170 (+) comp39694_c0_seq1:306-815(+)